MRLLEFAKVQVVKSKEDAERAWGYLEGISSSYIVAGIFGLATEMIENDDFI